MKGNSIKRAVCLLLIFALATGLGACGKPEGKTQDMPQMPEQSPLEQSFEIYHCQGFIGWNFCFPAAYNEYGAYISAGLAPPLDNPGGEEYSAKRPERELIYIDYESASMAPLEDHEWTDADLWSFFLCEGDYLFGFHYGYDGDAPEFPHEPRSYIVRTDLQGKNRTELVLPADSGFVFASGIAHNDGQFYFVVQDATRCSVLMADFSSMTVQTVHPFPETKYTWGIEAVQDSTFVIRTYNEVTGGARYCSLDISTGALTDIDEFQPVQSTSPVHSILETHEAGNIVAETATHYLLFTGYEPADTSLFMYNENIFPAFSLISKADYALGVRSGQKIDKRF